MARTVAEWIGKTDDTKVPSRVKMRVFERFKRACAKCGIKLVPGIAWDADHIKAIINGGENREANLQPLCLKVCHKPKTVADLAQKSADYQTRLSHLGPKKKTGRGFQTNRNGRFKKKMDGTVVRR